MNGRRMLVLPFAPIVIGGGTVVSVTAKPETPVYVDRFCMPVAQWDCFPVLEIVKVGRNCEPFDLAFAVLPDNPAAAYAVLPKPLRLAAGDELSAMVTNSMGTSRVFRLTALVFADDEIDSIRGGTVGGPR